MDLKNDIKDRLSIEDVVGKYVQLKRAGRNFKGLSPFTSEKTPSFVVSPEKQIWHDFSSNKGGDIFSFVMEVEGLDFKEAIKFLAQKAGVELKYYENAKSKKIAQQKERYYQMNKLAIAYYHKTLSANKHALDYVKLKRKFTEETIRKFELGYAPNSQNALVKFLQKRGFNKREIKGQYVSYEDCTNTFLPKADDDQFIKYNKMYPENEILKIFSDIATKNKELGTYLKPWLEYSENSYDGRIHSTYSPDTTSFRFASVCSAVKLLWIASLESVNKSPVQFLRDALMMEMGKVC